MTSRSVARSFSRTAAGVAATAIGLGALCERQRRALGSAGSWLGPDSRTRRGALYAARWGGSSLWPAITPGRRGW